MPAIKTRIEGPGPLDIRDLLLVALTFSSGAADAITYFGLGKIFSAFMTGNLVFLGFGVADAGGPQVLPAIIALAAFSVGTYLGTRLTLNLQQHSVWPRSVTVVLGLAAVFQVGFLAIWVAHDGQPGSDVTNILLTLLSLAMGMQTAAVRCLDVKGVFTTAATFTLVAFAGDFAGSRSATEMPRLAGVLVGLIAGAAAGGLSLMYARSYAPALPLAMTILVAAIGIIAFQRSNPSRLLKRRP